MRENFLALIVFSVLFSQNLFAAQNNDNANKKIPFAVYEQPVSNMQFSYGLGQPIATPTKLLKLKDINTSELSQLIKNVRETVCPAAGDGNIRMWVSVNAEAKLYILGAGAQSGFEVTLHCK